MTQSMPGVGKCLDNGPMEGFFSLLKQNVLWKRFKSFEEIKKKIVEYNKFYNEKRFQKRLECMAYIEYRNHAYKFA